MLMDTSLTVMTRRTKFGRRRRNFTLEELLTNPASGRREEIAQDFSSEIRNGCDEKEISETRAPCTEKRCKDD